MRMHKKIGRVVSGFLAALTLAASMPYAAAETDRQTIRVAFPTQEGMSFFGHSGKVTGYNYDYLEKISEYTGWEMEYVPYGSADGNEAAGSLRENNLRDRDVLRVGLWQTAETRNGEVLTYLKSENLPYEIVYYDTAAEQQQALVGGAVDVISSVSLSPVANTRIVAQFAPRPYYFASTKGNAALIDQLDETIRRIDLVEPNLQDSLYDNYFRVVNDAFYLTDAQKAALADMGTLRVLCTENAAPYAYRAGEAPAGMLVSILNNFAEKAGLKLEYTFAPTGRAPRR